MMTSIVMGLSAVLGLVILPFAAMPKVMKHMFNALGWWKDIAISLGMFAMLAGTATGALAAAIAGLTVSGFLATTRILYPKPQTFKGWFK